MHTNTFTLVSIRTYSIYLRVMYACIASNLIIHINRDGSIMCVESVCLCIFKYYQLNHFYFRSSKCNKSVALSLWNPYKKSLA